MGRLRCLLPRWLGLLLRLSSCLLLRLSSSLLLRLSSCCLRRMDELCLNLSSLLRHWYDWDNDRGWWRWVLDDDC